MASISPDNRNWGFPTKREKSFSISFFHVWPLPGFFWSFSCLFNDYQMDLCALLDPRVIHFHSSFTLPSSSSNPAKYSSDFPPPTFRTVSIRRSITLLRDKVIKMPLTTYIIYAHMYNVHSHSRISALVTLFPPQDFYNGHRSRREDYSRAVTMVQATPWDYDWELLQKI